MLHSFIRITIYSKLINLTDTFKTPYKPSLLTMDIGVSFSFLFSYLHLIFPPSIPINNILLPLFRLSFGFLVLFPILLSFFVNEIITQLSPDRLVLVASCNFLNLLKNIINFFVYQKQVHLIN
ncbi:hypothetical protein GLOIN_2v1548747 [Rhizophagus irregularis DAOM 181602=DAOM 197198]|uniref:Uncharacterized protein n=1 Tax=Rhizophagus irregularis (strain DAOM 181602 / DAOM 197198 / MUCL 43194) TaxID=747089 RepID=A0A2P4QHW6_RHIID|nr:hypothetical protein GLOIN_2v1548747 [Rhizophagus irregularis DAOM 181602=DAOM 197198]POG77218.1 hypothetical protein GLOIN_2v1548747 [Rhizophagus irregularis DAOM 181602=DAOM 197198]|eukprot:XP_025184084.1 hypothetical protein GLOIN_2v1548747 [Rhizophagus irregularis DAOM 181602=DAOM 197198]